MWLRALEADDMETIRQERNSLPPGILRTPYQLTPDMQMQWYRDEICNRDSRTRYWALATSVWFGGQEEELTVGYGGLENIQWETGIAEMSLMVYSKYRQSGYGREAVDRFLVEAFTQFRLDAVYAEVYDCNPNRVFWEKQGERLGALVHRLPMRKYLNGRHFGSTFYTFRRGND